MKVITQTSLQALRTGFSTLFNAGVGQAVAKSDPLCTPVTSATKVETYGFLGDMPIFREWVGEKRWKAIREKAYQLINRAFEASLGIHKHQIQDDNLGLYGPMVKGWGEDAASLGDRLAFEALANGHLNSCFDGQNFFDTDHVVGEGPAATSVSNMTGNAAVQPWFVMVCNKPLKPLLRQTREAPHFHMVTNMEDSHVLKTGEYLMSGEARGAVGYTYWQLAHRCTDTLNKANYEAVKLAIASLKDDRGEPLGLKPTHIVVGVSNVAAARDLFLKANLAGGESNVLFNDVVIIEADRLP